MTNNVPQHLPDELFTSLLDAANVRIERIIFSWVVT